MVVCFGCSCLCDDIEVDIESGEVKEVRNACRIGADLFFDRGVNRSKCTVDGDHKNYDDALKYAIDILNEAENPFIYGLDCSTLETQEKAVELARKLNACMDDSSSFSDGAIVEKIFKKSIKTCTLEDVRNESDVIVYWGSDPSNSHPRHLSKFSYFPRGEHRQKGWEIDRTLVCIDVRQSSTMKISRKKYIIKPESDKKLVGEIIDAMGGKVPQSHEIGIDAKKLIDLSNLLKKARHGIIFSGMGLTCALKNDLGGLEAIMEKMNELTDFHLIPMLGHYNTRGFNETLYSRTGYVNSVKFNSNGVTDHGPEHSFVESLIHNKFDAALIVGSDPLSNIPYSISKKLSKIPTITIDSVNTPTTAISKVVIPSAKDGIESKGRALRMDGIELNLEKIIDSSVMTEEKIITALIEGVSV